ncbi:MAG: HAD-IA family hydrolase [Flavobacteriaceae bacterium]|nr:HAD-IA family hydrolase [Flavobacteriaceae bacterium]
MINKKIELIIFDLDGTIVNSIFDIADAVNHVLVKMNRNTVSVYEVQKMIGSGVKKLIELALQDVSDEIVLANALKIFQEYYAKNLITKTRPYEDVIETLNQLSNFKKAIYSNKPQDLTDKVIKGLDLNSYFDTVQGADESKYKRKPSPEGINYILRKLKVKPENAIMVGDSTHDIHAGKRAGVKTCAVTYGYRDEKLLVNESPDYLIHKLTDLVNILKYI